MHTQQVINFLPSYDEFNANQTKWNSNEDVARILYSAQNHPDWIASETHTFPPSTSQRLFKRLDGLHFKQDGYEWKRRKEGKLIREDHVKLKVQKLETIAGSYVHSAIVPSFHRRTYWLCDHPEIVLVHYLNVTGEETRDGQPLHIRIAQSVRSNGLSFNRSQLEQQIRPILCYSMHPAEISSLLANVCAILNLAHSIPATVTYQHDSEHQLNNYVDEYGMEGIELMHLATDQPTNNNTNTHSERFQQHSQNDQHEQPSAHHPHHQLERSNSCGSAFRRGLSSIAMRRQPSAFSDTVDGRFTGTLLTNYAVESDASLIANNDKLSATSASIPNAFLNFASCQPETTNTLSKSAVATSEQQSSSSNLACELRRCGTIAAVQSNSATSQQHNTASCSTPLIQIADLSPDRSPLRGGTKVLIVGGWYLRGHDYTVMFDDQQVPATLFHAGVLRCFAPPHNAGVVKLEVYCDGLLISHAVQFEYLDMSRTGGQSAVLLEISERLRFFHSCMITDRSQCAMRELPELDTETVALEIWSEMMRYPFDYNLLTNRSATMRNDNSLLHLCAMLNFHRLIQSVLQFRSEISSQYYIRDLDVVSRDAEGRTPLHLAVLHANLNSIQILISNCPSSVDVLDDRGETPQDLIFKSQNSHIINSYKQTIDTVRHQAKASDDRCGQSQESINSTALWVMTNGETVTDEQRLANTSTITSSSRQTMLQIDMPVWQQLPVNHGSDGQAASKSCSASLLARVQLIYWLGVENGGGDSSIKSLNEYSDIDDSHHDGSSLSANKLHHCENLERGGWMDDTLAMDVHIPDSPTTADMWNALSSSDDATSEGARARMASLAQQIIDALPARIKSFNEAADPNFVDDVGGLSEPSESSGLSIHSRNPFLGNAYVRSSSEWEELVTPLDNTTYEFTSPNFMDRARNEVLIAHDEVGGPLDVLNASSSSSTFHTLPSESINNPTESANDHSSPNTSTKDLGEFFNTEGVMGPLERHFRDLRLSDREQRELYEAAKIIQHAYRQYKARISSQKQNEAERNAAVVIQSYYRRYKQFCYFKKLHKAAVLIQKHFRMHRALHCAEEQHIDEPLNDDCIRLTQCNASAHVSSLMTEDQAALTIQQAYRGHYQRKRQAAARKIQKFMRQSKQKLVLYFNTFFNISSRHQCLSELHFTNYEECDCSQQYTVCDISSYASASSLQS
ncbi:unnamed protein product [Anisakis simplex]|uniref:CG-1 domain-containing protein n=1 Tax=Anisakis simplex TaxID=6269 RepID=A0A158PMU5_ANISI|nr:unnamed protein product [Anisakis simplex]